MRTVLVTFVLAASLVALALVITPLPAQAQASDASQANAPANQKVIKDPAEYNTYMTALNTQDATQRGAAMEAFVKQYPQSVVLSDALDQAMAAYQAAGNQPKVQEIANRILQINPNAVRALAIVTFIERASAKTPEQAAKVRQDGEKGLAALGTWQKPSDLSDADFAKLKDQMTVIFAGAAGFGALQAKDYPAARDFYLKSVKIDPNLQDVYQLGIAQLEMNPIDKNGFWYIAKAYHLAQGNPAGQKSIADYGRSKYRKYHGNYDGWDQFLASTASQSSPPAVIAIAPAPSPQELACKAVQDNDPATLSFADWEYILQYRDAGPQCNKDAADKVWAAIQGKQKDANGGEVKIKLPGVKVIAAGSDSLDLALTEDNQQANKADLHVVMDKPLTRPPAVGSTIDVVGSITAYTPNPFMFTMTAGEVPGAGAKPPVRKPTPTHRPGAR
jgi:hypothetical protein